MGNTIKHSVLPSIIQCANTTIDRHSNDNNTQNEIPSALSSYGIITNNITNNKNGITINKSDGTPITTLSTPTNPTLEPTQQSTNNNIYDSQSILTPSSYGQIAHDIKCKKPGITINKSDDIQIGTSSAALISKHDRAPILTTDNTTEPAIIRDYKQSQQFIKHQYNIYATNKTTIISTASSKSSKGNNINIDRTDGAATYDYDTNNIRHKIWKPTKPTTTKTEPLKPSKHNKSCKAREVNKWKTPNMHDSNNNNNDIQRSYNTAIQSTNTTSHFPSISPTFEPTPCSKTDQNHSSNIKSNNNKNNTLCNPTIYPSLSPRIQSTNHPSNSLSTSPTLDIYICYISDPTQTSTETQKLMLAAPNMIPTTPKIIKTMKPPKPPNECASKVNINNNKTRYNNTGYDIVNDKDKLTEDYTEQIVAGQVAEVISSSFRNTGAPATRVLTVHVDNVGLSASGTQSSCDNINGYIKVNKEINDDMID